MFNNFKEYFFELLTLRKLNLSKKKLQFIQSIKNNNVSHYQSYLLKNPQLIGDENFLLYCLLNKKEYLINDLVQLLENDTSINSRDFMKGKIMMYIKIFLILPLIKDSFINKQYKKEIKDKIFFYYECIISHHLNLAENKTMHNIIFHTRSVFLEDNIEHAIDLFQHILNYKDQINTENLDFQINAEQVDFNDITFIMAFFFIYIKAIKSLNYFLSLKDKEGNYYIDISHRKHSLIKLSAKLASSSPFDVATEIRNYTNKLLTMTKDDDPSKIIEACFLNPKDNKISLEIFFRLYDEYVKREIKVPVNNNIRKILNRQRCIDITTNLAPVRLMFALDEKKNQQKGDLKEYNIEFEKVLDKTPDDIFHLIHKYTRETKYWIEKPTKKSIFNYFKLKNDAASNLENFRKKPLKNRPHL